MGYRRRKKREGSVMMVQTNGKEGLKSAGCMVQEETGTGWVRAFYNFNHNAACMDSIQNG